MVIDHICTMGCLASWRVLKTVEVLLRGGYSKRKEAAYAAYCNSSEAVNNVFENNHV